MLVRETMAKRVTSVVEVIESVFPNIHEIATGFLTLPIFCASVGSVLAAGGSLTTLALAAEHNGWQVTPQQFGPLKMVGTPFSMCASSTATISGTIDLEFLPPEPK